MLVFLLASALGCSGRANERANGGGVNTPGSAGANGDAGANADAANGGATNTDGSLFVPALPNPLRSGDRATGLTLIALTLQQTAASAELYAAVRNDGTTPSCEAGMLTDFIDANGAIVASAGTTLESSHFYRTSSGTLISCIDPGEIAMGATSDLPASIVVSELASLDHAFPAFTVGDISEVSGLAVNELDTVTTAAGDAYTGVLTNDFAVVVSSASVNVFSLNRAGRPLSVATATSPSALAPSGAWPFQTDVIRVPGTQRAAYPLASFDN